MKNYFMRCQLRVVAVAVVAGGLALLPNRAQAVVFGTDALGSPITWTHTGVPGGSPPAGSSVANVGGELHLIYGGTGGDMEVQVSSATFFGANTFGAPWLEVTWLDNNTGGSLVPLIDVFATDTRSGFKSNRVTAGSLFGCCEHYGAARYNDPGTVDVFHGGGNTETRAAAGDAVEHRVLIGKRPDGLIEFIYDGGIPGNDVTAFPSEVFAVGAALGTDHSAWGTLELRVRDGEAGETFIFRSFQMGSRFGFFTGDTDLDGDVDSLDAMRTIANIGMTGVTRLQGDTNDDLAVTSTDLAALAAAYTGVTSVLGGATMTEAVAPGAATLIYDPLTGNVKLDPNGAPGDVINAFVLQTEPGGDEFNVGMFSNPYGNLLFDDSLFQIGAADDTLTGFASIADLGDIMPLGLDALSLAAFLIRAQYVGTEGTGLESFSFQIVQTSVIPEPLSLGLLTLGSLLLLAQRRRRPFSAACPWEA